MSQETTLVGVVGGRDPRAVGGVEAVVRNVAVQSRNGYEFVQYCAGPEAMVERSEVGTIRTFPDGVGRVRSKHVYSVRAAYDLRQRDVDLVHSHGDNALGLSVFPPSVPHVVTFHGTTAGMYANVYADGGPLRTMLARIRPLPERLAGRQCDVAVACSDKVRAELVSHYGIDSGKVEVIPNGVDTRRFAPVPRNEARRRLSLDEEGPYALWVGTDPRRKGLETAVAAVESTDADLRLLVAGIDGDDAGRVEFLGRVPDSQMAALYSAADVLLFPSLYEGFGLVMLEALACGTPVVSSTAVARLGTGVRYVDEHTAAAYAQSIEAVVTDPPAPEALREFAVGHDWSRVAARYTDLYDRMTSG
jgi:glycosyltransferase involved in cell wall biosynthesis